MANKPNFFRTLTDDEKAHLLANDLVLEGEALKRFWRMEEFNSPCPEEFDLNTNLLVRIDDCKAIEKQAKKDGFPCAECRRKRTRREWAHHPLCVDCR